MSSLYVVNTGVPQQGECPEAERGRLTAAILTYAGNVGVGHVVTPERLAGMSVAELRGMVGMIPDEYAPGVVVANAAGSGEPPALQDVRLPVTVLHFDNPLAPPPAAPPTAPSPAPAGTDAIPVMNAAVAFNPWGAGPPALQDVQLPLPVMKFENPVGRR
ncbi:MAG TPA: hypothetical protein VGF55_02040 [Gemmataceae bacterium]|jgi:hypothetical protein